MMKVSYEETRLQLGLSGGVFAADVSRLGDLPDRCWVVDTWKFMHSYGISVEESLEPLRTKRVNDSFLMDVLAAGPASKTQLSQVNRCRLFLQIQTLFDMVTGDGRRIREDVWKGKRTLHFTSNISWPKQENPPSRDWTARRKVLGQSLLASPFFRPSDDTTLKQSCVLEPWTDGNSEAWLWLYSA